MPVQASETIFVKSRFLPKMFTSCLKLQTWFLPSLLVYVKKHLQRKYSQAPFSPLRNLPKYFSVSKCDVILIVPKYSKVPDLIIRVNREINDWRYLRTSSIGCIGSWVPKRPAVLLPNWHAHPILFLKGQFEFKSLRNVIAVTVAFTIQFKLCKIKFSLFYNFITVL